MCLSWGPPSLSGGGVLLHLLQLPGLAVLLLGEHQVHLADVVVQDEAHFGLVELLVVHLKVLHSAHRDGNT